MSIAYEINRDIVTMCPILVQKWEVDVLWRKASGAWFPHIASQQGFSGLPLRWWDEFEDLLLCGIGRGLSYLAVWSPSRPLVFWFANSDTWASSKAFLKVRSGSADRLCWTLESLMPQMSWSCSMLSRAASHLQCSDKRLNSTTKSAVVSPDHCNPQWKLNLCTL